MEDCFNLLVSAIQLGLDEAEDVGANGFHLVEDVQNVSTVIS